MQTSFSVSGCVRNALAVGLVLGAGVLAMTAQTAAVPSSSTQPTLNLNVPSLVAQESSSSSSSVDSNQLLASAASHSDFLGAMNAMQYGGRSRTGRPRYRGGNQNPDGSNKYEFYIGVGATAPVADTRTYYTPSYAFGGGVMRNFSSRVGVGVEFNWDNMNLQGSTLQNQQNLYNTYINYFNQYCLANPNDPNCANGAAPNISGLDAYSHVWSFSLQPQYRIPLGETLGFYVTGGAGFYHKVTVFTEPGTGTYCDPYYGYCYQYSANQPIDKYVSNAPGINAGLGLTYKFSRFSAQRFFVEARYVYTFNSPRAGVTAQTASAANIDATNDYPANSNRTSFIPVKVGIRF